MELQEPIDEEAVRKAILRQGREPEDHDLSLIRERLRWTPEERLEANASLRPSADAENPFSTRSPATMRWGAAPPVAARRQSPTSPRSSAATVSDRPSGDQEGRT